MVNLNLNLEDLNVAQVVVAGSATATEAYINKLAVHTKMLPPGVFDELVRGGRKHIAALRRVSDALLDAELELRFPQHHQEES